MEKRACEIKNGKRFLYGGVEWVKLARAERVTFALSAEPVFDAVFDKDNMNDWCVSELRRGLNGPFLESLVKQGADREAFIDFESDLTADDGAESYGEAFDKIALLTCEDYRQFRGSIPPINQTWWTLTPWTCIEHKANWVRTVGDDGAFYDYEAGKEHAVRPFVHLNSDTVVTLPAPDATERDTRAAAVEELCDAILSELDGWPVDLWGEALGTAVMRLYESKCAADEIRAEREERLPAVENLLKHC